MQLDGIGNDVPSTISYGDKYGSIFVFDAVLVCCIACIEYRYHIFKAVGLVSFAMKDLSSFALPGSSSLESSRSSNSLSISGLEVDNTKSGPQNVSHDADEWKVLQGYSNLEQTPAELVSENVPEICFGHEQLEAHGEDEPKEVCANVGEGKAPETCCKRDWTIAALLVIAIVTAVILSSILTRDLKHHPQ